MKPIEFWNRYSKKLEKELVYGEDGIQYLYGGSRTGKWLESNLLSRKTFSQLMGVYFNSPISKGRIPRFIDDYRIDRKIYENEEWESFNHFFIRKFLPGVRSFSSAPNSLPAFAEGRYFAYPRVEAQFEFKVKGVWYSFKSLLGDGQWSKKFKGGPLFIARLCPVDYHRFHFPDDGIVEDAYRIPGKFHSVNPAALEVNQNILQENERQVTILKTENFGLLAYVEVGAMGVGKIIQSYVPRVNFKRGEEKGYFQFGASTVIVMGVAGAWSPDPEMVKMTERGIETYVHLGDEIASNPRG